MFYIKIKDTFARKTQEKLKKNIIRVVETSEGYVGYEGEGIESVRLYHYLLEITGEEDYFQIVSLHNIDHHNPDRTTVKYMGGELGIKVGVEVTI